MATTSVKFGYHRSGVYGLSPSKLLRELLIVLMCKLNACFLTALFRHDCCLTCISFRRQYKSKKEHHTPCNSHVTAMILLMASAIKFYGFSFNIAPKQSIKVLYTQSSGLFYNVAHLCDIAFEHTQLSILGIQSASLRQ